MGWEWRAFFPAEEPWPSPPNVVGPAACEERTDVYLPCGASVGVKLRAGKRIEAKHLQHTTETLRIESWRKERSGPTDTVEGFLASQLRDHPYDPSDVIGYPRIRVSKRRASTMRAGASVEQADMELALEAATEARGDASAAAAAAASPPSCAALHGELDGLTHQQLRALATCSRWRSLCVEGPKHAVKDAVRHFVGPMAAEWPGALVMGYPRFVHAFAAARAAGPPDKAAAVGK